MKAAFLLIALLALPSVVVADNLRALLDASRNAVDSAVEQNRVEEAAKREAARRRAAQAARQPLSPDAICDNDEDCWGVLRTDKKSVIILCTQGHARGLERCVMHNDDGYWADGCGLTSAFAFHHKSMEIAARLACGL